MSLSFFAAVMTQVVRTFAREWINISRNLSDLIHRPCAFWTVDSEIFCVGLSPADNAKIIAVSADDGVTWKFHSPAPFPEGILEWITYAVSSVRIHGKLRVYMLCMRDGSTREHDDIEGLLYVSDDMKDWTRVSATYVGEYHLCVTIVAMPRDKHLYAYYPCYLYETKNDGMSWEEITHPEILSDGQVVPARINSCFSFDSKLCLAGKSGVFLLDSGKWVSLTDPIPLPYFSKGQVRAFWDDFAYRFVAYSGSGSEVFQCPWGSRRWSSIWPENFSQIPITNLVSTGNALIGIDGEYRPWLSPVDWEPLLAHSQQLRDLSTLGGNLIEDVFNAHVLPFINPSFFDGYLNQFCGPKLPEMISRRLKLTTFIKSVPREQRGSICLKLDSKTPRSERTRNHPTPMDTPRLVEVNISLLRTLAGGRPIY